MDLERHYSIGEFSRASGVPAKTLRFYHEKGLLVPAAIDPATGYRSYDHGSLERARVIVALRKLEFSLDEIGAILSKAEGDEDILDQLDRRKQEIAGEIVRRRSMIQVIDSIVRAERDQQAAALNSPHHVQESELGPLLVAGIRMTGRYEDCGKAFGKLARKLGRFVAGKAMCLYCDAEYREDDADFEPCFPVSKAVTADGIACHELGPAHVIRLVHAGPYDQLHRSYARLLESAATRGLELDTPSREVYLKGPGMIFKGNPDKYLTEIQIPLK